MLSCVVANNDVLEPSCLVLLLGLQHTLNRGKQPIRKSCWPASLEAQSVGIPFSNTSATLAVGAEKACGIFSVGRMPKVDDILEWRTTCEHTRSPRVGSFAYS